MVYYFIYYTEHIYFFLYLDWQKNNFGNGCIPKDLLYSVTKLDYSKIHHSASILSLISNENKKCDRGKDF